MGGTARNFGLFFKYLYLYLSLRWIRRGWASPCGIRRECPPSFSCRSPGRSLCPPAAALGWRGWWAGVPAPAGGEPGPSGAAAGVRRGCRGAVKGFCSPALRRRPDRAAGQPCGEEGAGGGRYPAEGAGLKSGSLLPPLSSPPAPGVRQESPCRNAGIGSGGALGRFGACPGCRGCGRGVHLCR